ncbi:MAG TPA: hypothetical protein VII83_07090 [Gaiellaceae bacterium]|jgi:hypothetical protein
MPSLPIYLTDSNQRPDVDFLPGELRYLVGGNKGRLLDARRTPIEITGIDIARGYFEVEIQAFEDEGAHWLVPLEDADHYQFEIDSRVAPSATADELGDRVRELDRPMTIEIDSQARTRTLEHFAREKTMAIHWLDAHAVGELDPSPQVEARYGDPVLFKLSKEYLHERQLEQMDSDFARVYVSNPSSGERVKGHAVVLAELGLCRYEGKIIRDPKLFDEEWSKARRAQHILVRLAFTQAFWTRARQPVFLYRGFSTEESLDPRPTSFVSATFSKAVAEAHHPSSVRQQTLPLNRLFMTFLETEAMNRAYHEAEAVLIDDEQLESF